ncbi:MI domain-containing protein [Balamuthia mandrillaris]
MGQEGHHFIGTEVFYGVEVRSVRCLLRALVRWHNHNLVPPLVHLALRAVVREEEEEHRAGRRRPRKKRRGEEAATPSVPPMIRSPEAMARLPKELRWALFRMKHEYLRLLKAEDWHGLPQEGVPVDEAQEDALVKKCTIGSPWNVSLSLEVFRSAFVLRSLAWMCGRASPALIDPQLQSSCPSGSLHQQQPLLLLLPGNTKAFLVAPSVGVWHRLAYINLPADSAPFVFDPSQFKICPTSLPSSSSSASSSASSSHREEEEEEEVEEGSSSIVKTFERFHAEITRAFAFGPLRTITEETEEREKEQLRRGWQLYDDDEDDRYEPDPDEEAKRKRLDKRTRFKFVRLPPQEIDVLLGCEYLERNLDREAERVNPEERCFKKETEEEEEVNRVEQQEEEWERELRQEAEEYRRRCEESHPNLDDVALRGIDVPPEEAIVQKHPQWWIVTEAHLNKTY